FATDSFSLADLPTLAGLTDLDITRTIAYTHLDLNPSHPTLQNTNVRNAIEDAAIWPQAMTTRWQAHDPFTQMSGASRDTWERFARYLQYERRVLFDARQAGMEAPRQWLPLLLPRLESNLPGGHVFYRGRGGVHSLAEMGAPHPSAPCRLSQ